MDSIGLNDNVEDIDSGRMSKWASSSHDRQDLADLHKRFSPKIRAFIASRVGSDEDAEDIAQDVFVELHKKNGWHDRTENPEGYIFGIAKNLIRRYYRKREKSIKTIPIEEIGPIAAAHNRQQDSDPESRLQKQELAEAIEVMLAKLPPKAQQSIKLRFFDCRDSKEATKKAGCTYKVFRNRLNCAITAIRKEQNRFGSKSVEKK